MADETQHDLTDEDLEAQLAYEHFKQRREAKRRKRILVIVALVATALVAAVVFAVRHAGGDEAEGEFDPFAATAMVYRDDFATTVSANGATEPLSSTVVTPEVEGIIENVQVEEGAYVEAGTVLFTVKNDAYDKAIREASAQVDSAERSARMADRAVDDAYAAYNRAWRECNEMGDWSAFDESGLNAGIENAEAAFEDAKLAVENAKLALAEAQETADKRTVRAPVSGSVVAMNAVNGAATGGAAASATGPLVQICDLSQMKVTVQVNEVDIASISAGQAATATFSALPDVESEATVQRIASVATGAGEGGYGGVVTYAVDLLIPAPDPKLKPGMTATVTITTQSAPNSLIVPASAVWEGADAARYVTVVEDAEAGSTRDVAVEVVEENSSEAAVNGALEEGDLVLLGGGPGFGGDFDEAFSEDYLAEETIDGAVG